jgi:cytochrome c-type biogenesis protein CcmH
MRRLAAIAWLSLFAMTGALAVTPSEMMKDPALESRARALSAELRCLVCQNQSIDDSDAPLAHDIRVLLRERLAAGDSNQSVVDFLVARYGEFILLRPRLSLHTVLLWAIPFATVIFGGAAIAASYRRRRNAVPTMALSAAEEGRLSEIVGGSEPPPV